MAGIDIERRAEDRLGAEERGAIVALLEEAFPGVFAGRTYFKQLSTFRYLARSAGEVVGQVGVIDRVVRMAEEPARIFGVVDLCVRKSLRSRGIGGALVGAVETAARAAGADFMVLFADDHRLYHRLGFRRAANTCTYLALDEHRTLGVQTHSLEDCLMVRELGERSWKDEAPLDLLGHVF